MKINVCLALLLILFALAGCTGINRKKASKPQKPTGSYVFTRPDSSHYRMLHMPGDKSNKLGPDKKYVKPFDPSQAKELHLSSKRRYHPELTVADLKSLAAQHQVTLVALCNPGSLTGFQYNTVPFLDMAKKLDNAGVQLNNSPIGVVLISVSYDLLQLDKLLTQHQFIYPSYIIPAKQYGEKILLKEIFFIKELCPECWQREKDYVSDYKIFMLGPEGNVIDKLPAPGDQKFYYEQLNRMANYAIKVDSLYKATD